MVILDTDLKYYHSGAGANANQAADLGGARSSVEITDNTLHNTFSLAPGTEAASGSVKYRCHYVRNQHATLTYFSPKLFISQDTTGTSDEVDIGLGSSAINGTEQTIANEDTAPTGGVTFSHPTTYASGLTIPDLAPNDARSYWERRTITAASAAVDNDTFKVKLQGDSGA